MRSCAACRPSRRAGSRPRSPVDEEADDRRLLEQEATEVGEPAPPVAPPAEGRLDPDLLELHGLVRPCRGLRLEEDVAVAAPDPAPPLLHLRAGPPLEERRVARVCVDADL